MIEIVYKGHDNKATIVIMQDGAPLDLSAVTRMTLRLHGAGVLADSDSNAAFISWAAGGGQVEFDLGSMSLPRGIFRATLVAYDAMHPNGQVLANPASASLTVRVV